jgi:hypothetical protein
MVSILPAGEIMLTQSEYVLHILYDPSYYVIIGGTAGL